MSGVAIDRAISALRADRQQLSALEAAPTATPGWDSGLEKNYEDRVRQLVSEILNDPSLQAGFQSLLSGVDQPSAQAPAAQPLPPTPQEATPAAAAAESDGTPTAPAATQSPPLGGSLPPELSRLQPIVDQVSKATGQDPSLLAAQIWDESRGKSSADTTNGGTGLSDAGLMQVDAATFKDLQQKHPELQGKNLGDDATNVLAGSLLFMDLKKQFGSDALALRAYNSGAGSVDPNDPNATTTGLGDPDYLKKVFAIQGDIRSGAALPA